MITHNFPVVRLMTEFEKCLTKIRISYIMYT